MCNSKDKNNNTNTFDITNKKNNNIFSNIIIKSEPMSQLFFDIMENISDFRELTQTQLSNIDKLTSKEKDEIIKKYNHIMNYTINFIEHV